MKTGTSTSLNTAASETGAENSSHAERGKPTFASRLACWPLAGLAAILVTFVAVIAWLRPAANFGNLQDDALYFALGKALAAGKGFLLPSFPGGLTTLKCPALYPWLLSWVWRLDPNFPGNVVPAIALTVAFGCWFLVACWLVGKRTMGLGSAWALVLTAFCAFNFFVLFLSGSVMSDLPFAALALSAVLAADRSLEPDGHWGWMALAAVLAGLATGLRTVGVTVIAGIALVALVRRNYRRAALICLAGGALALPWILPSILRLFAARHPSAPASLGWKQTIALYSNYMDLWRNSVPNWATQRAVLRKNILSALIEPGIFLLFPLAKTSAFLSVGVGGLLTFSAWAGILYRLRQAGLKAIHGVMLFYLVMTLPYPFPPQRFMVLLLPLLLGGVVIVARGIALTAVNGLRGPGPSARRVQAALSGAALLLVGGVAAVNCFFAVPRSLAATTNGQQVFLARERLAYRWIGDHTPSDAVFIAYNDVLLYLYTGRQAIRPIVCTTTAYYNDDPSFTFREAAHLGDVARRVNAAYWVASSRDFDVEVGNDQSVLVPAENRMLARQPEVFRSSDGRIRIYDLHCFQNPGASGCPSLPASEAR